MNIVFFTHPLFMGSQSMPRFAGMLTEGMKKRGHRVILWYPKPRFFRFPVPAGIKKWMGYVDQFMVFPAEVRSFLKACPEDTLFVFTDHALGPWVPLVESRPHVIHCHDFLAQLSALGSISEKTTSWTGRRYQELIRQGFSRGRHFISVSEKTREDLHQLLPTIPAHSEVVYNGMNQTFKPCNTAEAGTLLGEKFELNLNSGYILHVGGNQWYKNRKGVVEIYNAWRSSDELKLPLLLIGKEPGTGLLKACEESPYKRDIYLLSNIADEDLQLAYGGASVMLFPSLAEGFGWPVAEAMASGCPVITTNEAPMSIVAGKAGFLIPRRPFQEPEAPAWAAKAAEVVKEVLALSPRERKKVTDAGLENVRRFDPSDFMDRIERIYCNIIQNSFAQ